MKIHTIRPHVSTTESDTNSGNEAVQGEFEDSAKRTSAPRREKSTIGKWKGIREFADIIGEGEADEEGGEIYPDWPALPLGHDLKFYKSLLSQCSSTNVAGRFYPIAGDYSVAYFPEDETGYTAGMCARIAQERLQEIIDSLAGSGSLSSAPKRTGKPWTHVSGARLMPRLSARGGTLQVNGSNGSLTADFNTGKVLDVSPNEEYPNDFPQIVDKVDVAEYKKWCKDNDLTPFRTVDTLLVGFWTKDGQYQEPEDTARQDTLTDWLDTAVE